MNASTRDLAVAQIWLTYEELGEFCNCTPVNARNLVLDNNWSRRKSGDGLTRVKLPQTMMRDYIGRMAANWQGVRPTEIGNHDSFAEQRLPYDDVPLLNGSAGQDIDHDMIAESMSQSLRSAFPGLQAGSRRTRSA